MRKVMSKAAVVAVAALSLCAALVASSEPASAQFRHGGVGGFGGFHGGMGGFGGWHGGMGGWGGGWRTAGWRGGWRGGWGGWGWRGGWGGCRWGGCGWGGGWWWPAGVATGVALASYPYWGGDYGYGYDNGCVQLVPVYSRRGFYLGRRWVNVCY